MGNFFLEKEQRNYMSNKNLDQKSKKKSNNNLSKKEINKHTKKQR